ncbi:MAG: hypothetical protein Q7U30_10845 [Methylicorpusculum sp.]|nr:hypothetical protein [Methylicorpusculum sp.]
MKKIRPTLTIALILISSTLFSAESEKDGYKHTGLVAAFIPTTNTVIIDDKNYHIDNEVVMHYLKDDENPRLFNLTRPALSLQSGQRVGFNLDPSNIVPPRISEIWFLKDPEQ